MPDWVADLPWFDASFTLFTVAAAATVAKMVLKSKFKQKAGNLERKKPDLEEEEKPNFFDNMRNKQERCKGKPKTGECAEDRPTKKQWKKITAKNESLDKIINDVLEEVFGELEEKVDKKNMACNDPRTTDSHKGKSHVVKACEHGEEEIIPFGEKGASTAGKPKKGESEKMKKKRKSFKARHAKNIAKGKMSAAYWADKVKW